MAVHRYATYQGLKGVIIEEQVAGQLVLTLTPEVLTELVGFLRTKGVYSNDSVSVSYEAPAVSSTIPSA